MNVENRGGICDRIRKIESMGGGIFVKEAIVTAAQQLRGATPLASLFAWIALGLLLAEIAVRRLRPSLPIEKVTGAIGRAASKLPRPKGWPGRRKAPTTPQAEPASAAETPSAGTPPAGTPPKTRDDDIAAVLDRARKRRRGR